MRGHQSAAPEGQQAYRFPYLQPDCQSGISGLTLFQQEVIREVVCLQADFEHENEEVIETVLSSYSINGTSMQFTQSWNVYADKGVAMKKDTYALLSQTGLCCRLAR